MRSNKKEIASTLHTKGPWEGTRELSHTDSPGTGTGASRGTFPRDTLVSRGTMCPEQTVSNSFQDGYPNTDCDVNVIK